VLDTHRAVVDDDHHFTPHTHGNHEMLWGTTGLFTVTSNDRIWMVTAAIGIIVPAGVRHGGFGEKGSSFYQSHFAPDRFPLPWDQPMAVPIPPVLRELLIHLATGSMSPDARARAEQVAFELVQPVTTSPIELPMPRDDRALRVAEAVLADPADSRSLARWGHHVGAGERTLTRLFAQETSMSFAVWRAHARVSAAVSLLAGGESVATVAQRVGYSTPSSFIRIFREVTGQTPGAYIAAAPLQSSLGYRNSVAYRDDAERRLGYERGLAGPVGPARLTRRVAAAPRM
jgi:AraC-like DNA-binding protein